MPVFILVIAPSGCATLPAISPGLTGSATDEFDLKIARAVEFRKEFGLRADVPFVEAVAQDHSRRLDFGVPLLPSEVAELENRNTEASRVVPVLESYGEEHRDEFGGLFQDQQRGGLLVMLFTNNLDDHVQAVRRKLRQDTPGVPVRFGLVAHTRADLDQRLDQVTDDIPVWRAQGIEITAALVDVPGNVVEIDVYDPPQGAESALEAEYGAPWIRFKPTDKRPSWVVGGRVDHSGIPPTIHAI